MAVIGKANAIIDLGTYKAPTPGQIDQAKANAGKTTSTSNSSSGFDLGGLFDNIFNTAGKYIDYQTAKVGGGTGSVVYQTVPSSNSNNSGGGFNFSNPIVLVALGVGAYLLLKN